MSERATVAPRLAAALGTRHLRVTLNSTAVQNELRQYDSGAVLRSDVVNARMWLGIHFRSADEVGVRMGEEIAEWAMDRYFEPVHHH